MRIAIVSWESLHALPVGGVAVHASHLADALAKLGHEVHLFTRLGPNQRLDDFIFGVHYHRCPWETRSDFIDEASAFCDSVRHYMGLVAERTGAFDWVLCHDWLAVRAGAAWKGDHGSRMALIVHTTEWSRRGVWPEGEASRRVVEIERLGLRAADAVLVTSQEIRRKLHAFYHGPDWKQGVVYPGIDPTPFDAEPYDAGSIKSELGLDPLAPTLLFVGSLTHRKGPDLLLGALPSLRDKVPGLHALLVGEGDLRHHLEREAERAGLQERVRFLGWKQGKELADLYRACDAVCCPYRDDPFGMTALSAWAASKPVIATRAGVPAEIVKPEDTGLLCEADPEALTSALRDAFSDFDRLRWMGRNGRVAAETAFSWKVVAEKTLQVCERAVRLGRTPQP